MIDLPEEQKQNKVREPVDKGPVHCWGKRCNGRIISGKNKVRHWRTKHKDGEKNMTKCFGPNMCSDCDKMLDKRVDGKQSVPTLLTFERLQIY